MNYEILAPAGGEECAYVALNHGANAIYLGLSQFSARAKAENFDVEALKRVLLYAHILGAKVYCALNTLVKDCELSSFFHSAVTAWNCGVDGILLQDLFLGKRLKEEYPQITLHLSTQAGCCNEYGARQAKAYGFSRVVLARETPLAEIRKISKIIETEVFVQGALCSSFSGHCYFSSFAGNNSGNRGRCKQPCRKKYSINRAGFETPKYALSLSDLSVGGRVKELLEAGVYSLKIEGRLRRPEYVSASVSYYRSLIEGERANLSALKRTYNRGDYTEGLAFGQKGDFLSRDVQGHIGEEVGKVTLVKGRYFCKSAYPAQEGDGFKILRGVDEVGGATFAFSATGGFFLKTSARLNEGDTVRVTTDMQLNKRLLAGEKRRNVRISLSFVAGKRAVAHCKDLTVESEFILQEAQRAPLTKEELTACFQKVDTLPLSVQFYEVETQNAFLPKSQLNAFRREFLLKLCETFDPPRTPLQEREITQELTLEQGGMTAFLTSQICDVGADITIYQPDDYTKLPDTVEGFGKSKVFLYLPPFLSSEDEGVIADKVPLFDGIYGDGYYALELAKKYEKPFFAGLGFHLSNSIAVAEVKGAGATYLALSHELCEEEQRLLSVKGAFALTAGDIKVMDLIYCPFFNTCATCDKKRGYTLTDEGGREFPLRRYTLSGKCRFEVYNCARLQSENGATSILVCDSASQSGKGVLENARSPEKLKAYGTRLTRGHGQNSVE